MPNRTSRLTLATAKKMYRRYSIVAPMDGRLGAIVTEEFNGKGEPKELALSRDSTRNARNIDVSRTAF